MRVNVCCRVTSDQEAGKLEYLKYWNKNYDIANKEVWHVSERFQPMGKGYCDVFNSSTSPMLSPATPPKTLDEDVIGECFT